MRLKYLLALALFSVAATGFAQKATPVASDTEINGRMSALQGQRNEANDRLVYMLGQIAELQAELTKAKQAADSCKQPAEKK